MSHWRTEQHITEQNRRTRVHATSVGQRVCMCVCVESRALKSRTHAGAHACIYNVASEMATTAAAAAGADAAAAAAVVHGRTVRVRVRVLLITSTTICICATHTRAHCSGHGVKQYGTPGIYVYCALTLYLSPK